MYACETQPGKIQGYIIHTYCGDVTSVSRKEMAAKANDQPYL